jgi:6-phosphogluconolactonase/glucosamine-6-phosphate isomerase/deaminase
MQFIPSSDWQTGIDDLSKRLIKDLTAGKRVLWMVPGGSAINAVVRIMENIPTPLSNLLSVTLTDERYGEPGHADSNWQQLTAAGFLGKESTLLPVLISGKTLEEVVIAFDNLLSKAFKENEVIIVQLGIGPDGHTAGILPGSDATSASGLATGYATDGFTRITSTFAAIEQATAAYVMAFGAEKRPTLLELREDRSLVDQPAQILKRLPEAYIYSDQVESV